MEKRGSLVKGKSGNRTVAFALAASWFFTLADGAHAQAARKKSIDEIVVYARKRAELIEDTPVSITAFNADQLKVTGTTRIDQIQTMVPNLTMLRGASGQSASFNMRGIGNFPGLSFDQGVGVYVDGVYMSRNAGSVLDLVDTASIEVLRGPQGTLFGKNTLGGAINITTIKPKNEFEASVFVRAGSYDQIDTRATLNIPLGFHLDLLEDRLFGRFTFANFYNEGYMKNTVRDQRASDRNSVNFLGSLRYLLTDDATFDVSGSWAKSTTHGLGAKCIYIDPQNVDVGFQAIIDGINQIVTSTGAPASDYRDRCNATTPSRFAADGRNSINVESYGAWGVLNWDIGEIGLGGIRLLDDLSFKYTGGWREQVTAARVDIDQTAYPIVQVEGAGGGPVLPDINGKPVDIGGAPQEQRQIQQELQINASAWQERLHMVGGVWGFWDDADEQTGINYLPGTLISDPEIGIGLGPNLGTLKIANWDWALYFQGTLELTEWLSVTGGVRYTEEKKGVDRKLEQPSAHPPLGDPVPVDFSESTTFTNVSPAATVALTAPESWLEPVQIDHLMTYFRYAEGFRGGGFNGPARLTTDVTLIPFKPETNDSYEVGVKGVLFDRRLTFSLAYFHDELTDQQIPQIITQQCTGAGCPPIPLSDVLIRNSGQSTVQGVELEFATQPIEGLGINGSVGYLDAVYDDFPMAQDPRTGEFVDRDGERFNFIPEWKTFLGVQYSIDTMDYVDSDPAWLAGTVTPRIDWSWQSKIVNWAPELPELTQDPFHLINFRTTYSFNDDSTQFAFFINNVTDEKYFRDSVALGPRLTLVVGKYYQPPRWYGIELTQSF